MMAEHGIYEDLSRLQLRSRLTLAAVLALAAFLILFLWKIQILEHGKYWQRAEANRIRETVVSSPRGLVLDREGHILAQNVASFKVSFIRENCVELENCIGRISSILDLEPETIRKRMDKYGDYPDFMPVPIDDNLDDREVARIEARKAEMSELVIEAEPKRTYPLGSVAAHILGYIQEISFSDIKAGTYPSKRLGDLIGRTGIEMACDSILQGKDGRVLEVVDSLGRTMQPLFSSEPSSGNNVRLTIDLDLQNKAEELLSEREGAIVVLSPVSGEVLAMASFPTYDPNKFINRFSPQEWQAFISNPDFPLENRAIRGLYSPGSIFKLTMGLAGLELSTISDQTTFWCDGQTVIYGHPFNCWFSAGHGAMNLASAIQNSCNIYFYNLGRRIGIDNIAHYARRIGFGARTGIELPGEKEGLVPDPEWKERVRGAPWYPGETISIAIGQGPLLVTPLQVASTTALIANRGRMAAPHLVLSTGARPNPEAVIDPSNCEKIIVGMWESVNRGGTGRAALIDGFDVCGKTGSTQVIGRETAERLGLRGDEIKTHSWFTGFAPRNDPQVVVTVLVEFGGMGGSTAAPLARQILELYRNKYGGPR